MAAFAARNAWLDGNSISGDEVGDILSASIDMMARSVILQGVELFYQGSRDQTHELFCRKHIECYDRLLTGGYMFIARTTMLFTITERQSSCPSLDIVFCFNPHATGSEKDFFSSLAPFLQTQTARLLRHPITTRIPPDLITVLIPQCLERLK